MAPAKFDIISWIHVHVVVMQKEETSQRSSTFELKCYFVKHLDAKILQSSKLLQILQYFLSSILRCELNTESQWILI
jgi:hypothetical protein